MEIQNTKLGLEREKIKRIDFSKLNLDRKGKTYEQIYGIEKAKKMKEQKKKMFIGKGNPFYGKVPWNKGKKGLRSHSLETKIKLKVCRANQINSPENNLAIRKKISTALKGKSYEEVYGKTKADQMRKSRSNWATNSIKIKHKNFGFPKDGTMKERRKLQVMPMQDTAIELKLQKFLGQLKLWNIPHFYIGKIEHGYQSDVYLPKYNLIIEMDGNYWHGNPRIYRWEDLNNMQKEQRYEDAIRTAELKSNGFNILRIWEDEMNAMYFEDFKKLIENKIGDIQLNKNSGVIFNTLK